MKLTKRLLGASFVLILLMQVFLMPAGALNDELVFDFRFSKSEGIAVGDEVTVTLHVEDYENYNGRMLAFLGTLVYDPEVFTLVRYEWVLPEECITMARSNNQMTIFYYDEWFMIREKQAREAGWTEERIAERWPDYLTNTDKKTGITNDCEIVRIALKVKTVKASEIIYVKKANQFLADRDKKMLTDPPMSAKKAVLHANGSFTNEVYVQPPNEEDIPNYEPPAAEELVPGENDPLNETPDSNRDLIEIVDDIDRQNRALNDEMRKLADSTNQWSSSGSGTSSGSSSSKPADNKGGLLDKIGEGVAGIFGGKNNTSSGGSDSSAPAKSYAWLGAIIVAAGALLVVGLVAVCMYSVKKKKAGSAKESATPDNDSTD